MTIVEEYPIQSLDKNLYLTKSNIKCEQREDARSSHKSFLEVFKSYLAPKILEN